MLFRLLEESPQQVTTLACDIARQESDTIGRVPPERVRAVYLDLYQRQLPKLREAGVVDYSDALGEVLLAHSDEMFTDCIDAAARLDSR